MYYAKNMSLYYTKFSKAKKHLKELATAERGFTEADVTRAWQCWERIAETAKEERHAQSQLEQGVSDHADEYEIRKLERFVAKAKAAARKAADAWNSFVPAAARSVVSEELSRRMHSEKLSELESIEV